MVSIAIIVVLMVGVTKVFQYTSQAVSANQQLSSMIRDDRAAQATLKKDFDSYAADGPFIQFRSRVRTAFRNPQDEAADRDGNVNTYDFLLNGTEDLIPPALLNQRNHRIDILSFFARGLFQRQTGNDARTTPPSAMTFVAPMSSSDAFLWYGHLILADNGGFDSANFNSPFVASPPPRSANPNNYYATQWILGRMQILLVEPTFPAVSPYTNSGLIYDRHGVVQDFFDRDSVNANAGTITPLTENKPATSRFYKSATDPEDLFQRGRFDLAGTSITGYRKILSDCVGKPWSPLAVPYTDGTPAGEVLSKVTHNGLTYRCMSDHTSSAGSEPAYPGGGNWQLDDDWWSRVMGSDRFNCNPFAFRPLTAATYSQQYPVFMPNCTQFIVEYAGDFLKQDTDPNSATYGRVLDVFDNPDTTTAPHTDGQVDFLVTWDDTRTPLGSIQNPERPTVRREIRWYGLPRDVRGINSIPGYAANRFQNNLSNVVPLRDVVRTIASGGISPPANWKHPYLPGDLTDYADYAGAPFERFYTTVQPNVYDFNNPTLRQLAEYFGNNTTNNMRSNEFYACAWSPNDTVRPTMIRIIMTLDDPQGRLQEGQTFEYVFKLQK